MRERWRSLLDSKQLSAFRKVSQKPSRRLGNSQVELAPRATLICSLTVEPSLSGVPDVTYRTIPLLSVLYHMEASPRLAVPCSQGRRHERYRRAECARV